MSKQQTRDTAQLRHMNVLLEVGLALPEEDREAWLQALPPQLRALTPSLRVLLARATEETDGFMRRSAGRLHWRRAGQGSFDARAEVRAAPPRRDRPPPSDPMN